jgi:type IV secretory pathway VirJ component
MPWLLPLILMFSACEVTIVADLPITEVPAKGHPSMMAVMYSGDGGWRDIDKQISGRLAAAGVPVIGVDSLRYFWREKTPDQIARDLARVIARYGDVWHVEQVILIGYSFGADVLPFAINRLTLEIRSRLVQISLLGLARTADFEIHVMEWLGAGPGSEAQSVLPEIARLDPSLLQCFYGIDEEDSACPDPAFARAEVIKTKGGHHFGGDYAVLADMILAGARERVGARRRLPSEY